MKIYRENKLHTASLIMIIISFFLLLWIGYMYNFPRQVWELKTGEDGKVEILGDEFVHGELVPIKLDYCKYHNIEGEFYAQFVNGLIFTTPSVKGNIPKGCDKITSYSVAIPHSLPEGNYFLRLTYVNEANPFRTIKVDYITKSFDVIAD